MNIPSVRPRFACAPGLALVAAMLAFPVPTRASGLTPAAVAAAVRLATDAAAAVAPKGARIEAEAGALDPRLVLAPCARVEPYLAAGVPAWGRSRVGMRCADGTVRWNVYLPILVRVWAPAAVASVALAAGTRLEPGQLSLAVTDWGAATGSPATDLLSLEGRTLARPLSAGQALRAADLKPRQWFAAGETVSIVAAGSGFAVTAEGQAVGAGLEGQPVRVRTEAGRLLIGRPVAERRVEVGP